MSMPPPLQEARTQRHLDVLDAQSTTPSDLCSAIAALGVAIPVITPYVIASIAQA